MYRYGLASLFENYADGYEFTEENTPLHLTYVDAFVIDLSPDKFIPSLRQQLRDQRRFTVMPITDRLFGPNKDIPVTVIDLNPELKAFHECLMHFLESEGATFVSPHFLNDQYAPHISIYGPRRVKLGQSITITNVSLGHKRSDIENPPNRIISTIPLS